MPAAQASTTAATADGAVRVHWSMTYHCSYGQHVALVGDGPQLGAWEPDKAVALEWTDGDQWQTELSLVPGTRLEYKYVIRGSGGTLCYWKPGGNFNLEVAAAPGAKIEVQEDWTGTTRRIEVVQQAQAQAQAAQTQVASKAVARTRSLNPLDQQAQQSMEDLREAMSLHNKIMDRTRDPTNLEVIQADRVLAAANTKAVAMNKALKAADAFPQLPGPVQ